MVDEVGQPVCQEPLLGQTQASGRQRAQPPRTIRRARDVVVHLLDQLVDGVEAHHPPQPVHEGDLDLDAVELQVVTVEHVGLDPAVAFAVERRVGADQIAAG